MQTRTRILPIACILALAAPFAIAEDGSIGDTSKYDEPKIEDPKFYVEGLLGTAAYDYEYANINDDFTTVGIRAGYNLNNYLAIEGEYLAGTNTHNESVAFSVPSPEENANFLADRSHKLNAIYGVFGKASLPLNDRFAVHVRGGYAFTESEFSTQTTALETGETTNFSGDRQRDGFAFGAGGTLNITDKFYARADATQIAAYGDHVDSITLGLGVKF